MTVCASGGQSFLRILETIVLLILATDIELTEFRHVFLDVFARFHLDGFGDLQHLDIVAVFQFFQHHEECQLKNSKVGDDELIDFEMIHSRM